MNITGRKWNFTRLELKIVIVKESIEEELSDVDVRDRADENNVAEGVMQTVLVKRRKRKGESWRRLKFMGEGDNVRGKVEFAAGGGDAGMKRDLTELVVESSYEFRGRLIKVRTDQVVLPNGRRAHREVVEHPGAVAILAVTSENEVLLVRQYRHAVGDELLEIPAGKLEVGEDPGTCAARELREETGYRPGKLVPLGRFYTSPGFANEVIHVFLATGLTWSGRDTDGDEMILVDRVPVQEALRMARQGRFQDAKTLVALLWLDGGAGPGNQAVTGDRAETQARERG